MPDFDKIRSQKGELHVFSNGFLYRPDRNGYRCVKCNFARGRIEDGKFTVIGQHNHEANEAKIIEKLISNKFVDIALKYSLSRQQLNVIYDKYKIKYTQYSHLICSTNAIWLRARRNLEKLKIKSQNYKSKEFNEVEEKILFADFDALIHKIENKYQLTLKDTSNKHKPQLDTSVMPDSTVSNLSDDSLTTTPSNCAKDVTEILKKLPNMEQTNTDDQNKSIKLSIRDHYNNLIPYHIPIPSNQSSINYIIDIKDLTKYSEILKTQSNLCNNERIFQLNSNQNGMINMIKDSNSLAGAFINQHSIVLNRSNSNISDYSIISGNTIDLDSQTMSLNINYSNKVTHLKLVSTSSTIDLVKNNSTSERINEINTPDTDEKVCSQALASLSDYRTDDSNEDILLEPVVLVIPENV